MFVVSRFETVGMIFADEFRILPWNAARIPDFG
jgi:hypothetical protein